MAPATEYGAKRPLVVFGPQLPEIGSWEWVGQDMIDELSVYFHTEAFESTIPAAAVVVIVKYNLPHNVVAEVAKHAAVIFCPIDYYGSPAEIDRDAPMLRQCARIVTHADSLRKYLEPYAPVEYLDHHVKFARNGNGNREVDGPILWTGMRTNLGPLVERSNRQRWPRDLWVLTNLENGHEEVSAEQFGFRDRKRVRVGKWSAERHGTWANECAAAVDLKGDDFRQRHKPPAKAIDCIAGGIPLAMNRGSHSVEHLARLGFNVAVPEDEDRWFSAEYRQETEAFGAALREILSRKRVGFRFRRIIESVLKERGRL